MLSEETDSELLSDGLFKWETDKSFLEKTLKQLVNHVRGIYMYSNFKVTAKHSPYVKGDKI